MAFAHKLQAYARYEVPKDYKLLKWCARLLLFLVIAGIWAIPYQLVPKESNAYLQLFVKTLLPATGGCFSLFAFFDTLSLKLGLYQIKEYSEHQDEEQPFVFE